MQNNFSAALAALLGPDREGGFSDDPQDPGGATNHGITQRVWEEHVGHQVPVSDIQALSIDDVAPIYAKEYWARIRGDDLPAGVDYALFDFAVNSGVHEASKKLQEVIGTGADGVIGDNTLYVLFQKHSVEVIPALQAARLALLQGLENWEHDGAGWTRRVEEVGAEALALVS